MVPPGTTALIFAALDEARSYDDAVTDTERREFPVEQWAQTVEPYSLWAYLDKVDEQATYPIQGREQAMRLLLWDLSPQLNAVKERRTAADPQAAQGAGLTGPQFIWMLVAIIGIATALGLAGYSRTGTSDIDPVTTVRWSAISLIVGAAGLALFTVPTSRRSRPSGVLWLLGFLGFLPLVPILILLGRDGAWDLGWFRVEVVAFVAIVLLLLLGRWRRGDAVDVRERAERAEAFRRDLYAELTAVARAFEPRVAALNAALSSADRAYVTESLRRAGAVLAGRGLVDDPDIFTHHEPGMLQVEMVVRIVDFDRDAVVVTEIPRPAKS